MENFNMVVKVEVFSTDSCPHCPAAMHAALEAEKELEGIEVEIVKIVDAETQQRAMDYQIMAVPTIVINGNVEFVGAPSKEQLVAKLNTYL